MRSLRGEGVVRPSAFATQNAWYWVVKGYRAESEKSPHF